MPPSKRLRSVTMIGDKPKLLGHGATLAAQRSQARAEAQREFHKNLPPAPAAHRQVIRRAVRQNLGGGGRGLALSLIAAANTQRAVAR